MAYGLKAPSCDPLMGTDSVHMKSIYGIRRLSPSHISANVHRYLKNLKLFLIRVKELFEHIVLRRIGDGFLLFLKAFSWETDLWVIVGDFAVKNAKLGREICI